MRNKKAVTAMEVVVGAVLLLILLWVILAITIPKLKKLDTVEGCPLGIDVACVDRYSEAKNCAIGGVIEDYKCKSKSQICCRIKEEIIEIRQHICENTDGTEPNEQCFCQNQGEVEYSFEEIYIDPYYGPMAQDCSGDFDKFGNWGNSLITRYCLNAENDEGLRNRIVKEIGEEKYREGSPLFCFQNGLISCQEGVNPNSEACNCNEDGVLGQDDCDGADRKYCDGDICVEAVCETYAFAPEGGCHCEEISTGKFIEFCMQDIKCTDRGVCER